MDYRQEFRNKVTEFSRELLREKLLQTTNKQIRFFNRMYGSINRISEERMSWAYQQVCASIDKNKLEAQ